MDFNLAVDKNIDWKPKNPNKEHQQKNEFLWFVLSEKLNAFFWNFGLHLDGTFSVKFTVQKFPYYGMCH